MSNILSKFSIKKPKPAAPVKLLQPKEEEEFKPEEESDEEEDKPKEIPDNQKTSKDNIDSLGDFQVPNISNEKKQDQETEDSSKAQNQTAETSLDHEASSNSSENVKTSTQAVIESCQMESSKQPAESPGTSQVKPASKTKKVKKSHGNRKKVDIEDVNEREDQYVGWVPPENQSGDGRSSLNDKYGY